MDVEFGGARAGSVLGFGRRRLLTAFAVAALVALAGAAQASAATLTVCQSGPPACGYSGIQDAVNAAQSGDTIQVAAGSS